MVYNGTVDVVSYPLQYSYRIIGLVYHKVLSSGAYLQTTYLVTRQRLFVREWEA